MIAGPAISAGIGYIFFESSPIATRSEHSDGPCAGGGCLLLILVAVVIGLSVLLGAIRSWQFQANLQSYAILVGALAGMLAL